MWDCVPLADDAGEAWRRGGVHTIAISHPHYYTGMVDWAERLDARILLHEADREWITRPTERIELWSGDRLAVDDDHELVRLGGHFEGGTVCLWRGARAARGALLSGDVVQVVADRDWVSFMRSYPNLVPLAGARGRAHPRRPGRPRVRAPLRRVLALRRGRGRAGQGAALRGALPRGARLGPADVAPAAREGPSRVGVCSG